MNVWTMKSKTRLQKIYYNSRWQFKQDNSIDRQGMDAVRIEMFFFDHFKGSVIIRSWGRHVRSSGWRNTIRGHVLEVSTEARVSSIFKVRVTSTKMTSSSSLWHRVYLRLLHVSDAKCADCPFPFVSAQNITRTPEHGIICRKEDAIVNTVG